ncbi:MAG: gliding motility-associated C-terminal domain-containing protein, partial [Bacteroidota bacterium]|nr:gliding motility-associated C-terminal domain-containing protein [Bacteroidota bacterium]
TYTIAGTCGSTDTETITVNPVANATITAQPPLCTTSSPVNLTAAQAGGTWSGTGITNAATGTFNPATAGAGTHTITYTIGGACGNTDTETITVIAQPNATITNVAPVCSGSAAFNMTAATSGGTWTGTGITNAAAGTFDPVISGPGTFTITYTISGTCGNSDTALVTVSPTSNATITAVAPVCTNTTPFNFTAAQAGGTWSGTGITNSATGTFNPSTSGAGTFTITYTISGSCGNTDTETITVMAQPSATIASVAPVCSGSAAFNMTAATGGGTWTGTGITNAAAGTFNPVTSGSGTFTITYTIGGTCGNSDTALVTVTPTANATIIAVAPVCSNTAAFNFTAAQAGGTWTGTGITNSSSGTFDPAVSGPGTFTITYTISGFCGNTDTESILVNPQPSATINNVSPVCSGTPAFDFTAATAGGNWTGTGITNASSGTFDPSVSGTGSFMITYSIAGTCPNSDTSMVSVLPDADATINSAAPVCDGATAFNFTAAQAGGNWTGTGITGASSGLFDPSVSGSGTFTITYSITGTCGDVDTALMTVIPNADATITSPPSLCISAAPITLTGITAGGTWTGPGTTGTTSGTFDPASAGIGSHIITYTVSGSCGDVDTATIFVNASSDATIAAVSGLCIGSAPFNMVAATSGGVWSGTGITSSAAGTFSSASAGVGTHLITYTISGVCGATDTVNVTVAPLANATISPLAPLCVNASSVTLTSATGGGNWTGTGITASASGTFDPLTAGAGTHIITYTIPGSCGNTDTISIVVTAPANATITSVSPVCANAPAFNFNAATSGGTWSGTGITNPASGTFNPSIAGAGIHSISYMIGGVCGDTAVQNITVNALPTPSVTADITSGCAPVCVNFSESVSNNCSSLIYDFGDGNTSTTSSSLNCYAAAGSYDVTITCTDNNNCTGTTLFAGMINVFPVPVADFTVSPGTVVAPNTVVTFDDISSNGSIALWDFDDTASGVNNFSALPSPTHTFADQGIYCVRLYASNADGCLDSTEVCITVINDATYTVPNVFTPNGDNVNDVFSFNSFGLKDLNCEIFDRWGILVAEWNTVQGGWDGRTNSGNKATDGVYYFIMKATAVNGKQIEEKGFVQLLMSN